MTTARTTGWSRTHLSFYCRRARTAVGLCHAQALEGPTTVRQYWNMPQEDLESISVLLQTPGMTFMYRDAEAGQLLSAEQTSKFSSRVARALELKGVQSIQLYTYEQLLYEKLPGGLNRILSRITVPGALFCTPESFNENKPIALHTAEAMETFVLRVKDALKNHGSRYGQSEG